MIKDELEVAEFVKYLGIQTQSVYRRLQDKENRLQAYVVPNTKKVRIRKEALQDIYGKNLAELEKSTTQSTTQQEETPTPAMDLEIFKIKITNLEERLADKEKQLADKESYILKQQEQIDQKSKEINDLVKLVTQEQTLNLQMQKRIDDMSANFLLAPGKAEAPIVPVAPVKAEAPTDEINNTIADTISVSDTKKKKSFFSIFKW